ncbi:monosaccharide ABC transporter substrate-binding protein (CUT2 family) [Chelatococcus asaccharovorans]|uniref:Monosaccharide ABC transporter substrate-binding protein (CUT2 family) n=2 Tax=Chelatococcus asaccharovorans TaxID=28210 RepID=A0A2V3UKG0_9HYPH|nr:substrate-binding domain-containing protein [Chelatococcus asaccharovorans]MBS7706569.1 substrate-binding domain-containing protein [Chelatococcus asaccharovorans]PXW64784.1 monosaccharide ABC transporter substrate-binding protein (CUT2 family) [Chelatococcus asaccharovorans]
MMKRTATRRAVLGAAALLAAGGLVAFGGTAQAQQSFKIGLSNGWVGSEWRTQMIEEAQAAAAAWKAKGVNVEVVVQSATVDVQGQIGHVRNFINQGVNAIIINPNSPTAFDPVFAQAKARNILVVSTDAEVSSKDAIYVGIDQKDWAVKSAEWLAKTLGNKGNVVTINGIAGHPANEMRVAGYREVFAKHPDIKLLNQANADWDQAKGQQVMQNLLATYPNINGVWVQDGMADGAWRAIEAAGKKDQIAATGEIRKDFLTRWSEQKLNSGASVNPPGVMASALNVAVHRLMGKEFKDGIFKGQYGNAIYIPIPFVDNSNLAQALKQAEGKPGYWSVTAVVTPEEAQQYFK